MSDKCFVDTNILVYAHDLSKGAKHERARALIEDYSSWDIVVNTAESVLQALDIELRYMISFWDALIVQAATRCGAAVLYSEDLADGQNYGAVRVINPLK